MERLGDYVRIRTGKLDANAASPDGEYPFFTCSVNPLRIDFYNYDCECVLVAGNGDLNVKYYSGRFEAYQRTYIIESKNKSILSVPYLYFFMNKYIEVLRKQSIGGVIKYIKLEYLTEAPIPLPDVQTQSEIVRRLTQLNDLIEKCKKQLQKLDELVKSRFVEMFGDPKSNDLGWKTAPLYKVLESGSSVSYGIVQTGDHIPDGIPVFRPIDIADGRIPQREQLKCTAQEVSDKYSRTLLKGYELLITVRGSVGETFQVSQAFAGCNVGRNIVPLRFNTDLVLYPFMRCLFDQDGIKNVLASMTKGIALQGLNMSEFREIAIILPPISLQQKFMAFKAQTDKSKLAIQQSLEKLETLKKALMQKYFGR